ncbi:MAG: hypothetical protein Q8N88_02070 [Nanoarchaeota archaeon]|nr:hypothetical protein [Nanoarchaeota archaeon]
MPNLYSSKCNKCDFKTSVSSGGYLYVRDRDGNKVVCPHPLEYHTIAEVLGISKDDAFAWIQQEYGKISEETRKKIEDNIGMNFQHICLDCLAENFLDKKKDEIKCKKCSSVNLKYVADLVNKPCPKCKEGAIEMISQGMS